MAFTFINFHPKTPALSVACVLMTLLFNEDTESIIPEADSKKLIVVKKGKGVFVKVTSGIRTANGIEITSGIEPGDSVVVTGVLFVKPSSDVKVKSVKTIEALNLLQ